MALGSGVSMEGGALQSTSSPAKAYTATSLGGYGTILATLTSSGTLGVSGGDLNFGSGGSLAFSGGSPAVTIASSRALNNNTGGNMALDSAAVSLTNGTLGGANSFSSATLGGYGTIAAALTNNGTVTASTGTLKLQGASPTPATP